jgi:hypothetical protein
MGKARKHALAPLKKGGAKLLEVPLFKKDCR